MKRLLIILAFLAILTLVCAQAFTEIAAGLVNVDTGSVSIGDYDNDGDQDILISGKTGTSSTPAPVTRIYSNNGNGTFTYVNTGFTGLYSGTVDWGDYDNDGDLDVLVMGYTSTFARNSKVYSNNGNGTFTDINAAFTAVTAGSCAWGDYDNDGDLDVLMAGSTSTTRFTKVYRNDSGVFSENTSIVLQGLENSSVDWGDYDNDGDLDILATGRFNATYYSKIYRNDGADVFTDILAPFLNMGWGFATWADYDNDGDLDVNITGTTSSAYNTKLYRNDGSDTFVEVIPGFTAFSAGGQAWADYDNDGDLDLLITGTTSPTSSTRATLLYRNDGGNVFTSVASTGLVALSQSSCTWADFDNDGLLDVLVTGYNGTTRTTKMYHNNGGFTANQAPAPPTNLQSAIVGDYLVCSWNAGTDTETPSSALSYALRIGTTPGGSEITSAMSEDTGFRLIARDGIANGNCTWKIRTSVLQAQSSYYWSVQSIDDVFKGSPFATEAIINMIGSVPLAATNPVPADGAVNVAIDASLLWDAVTEATSYDVYFGTTLPGTPNANVLTPGWTPPVMLNNTLYSWMIVPKNAAGDALNCPTWTFTTIVALPLAASNPVPADAAVNVVIDATLSWDAVIGADSYDVYFGIIKPPTPNINVTNPFWTPPLMEYGTSYSWEVVPINAAGQAINTPTWTFTTIVALPLAAINPVPADGAVSVAIDASLLWDAATDATSYDVYFGTTLPGTPNANVLTPGWTPPVMLNNTLYSWMIVPKNAAGDALNSPVWTFTTIVALTAPANLVITNNVTDVVITWDAVIGADAYTVYSSTDPYALPIDWITEGVVLTPTFTDPSPTAIHKFYKITAITYVK